VVVRRRKSLLGAQKHVCTLQPADVISRVVPAKVGARQVPQPMNRLVLSVQKKFLIPVVILAAVLLWLGLCRSHYESYWNGTIHRVQTVDFNILHHTLPACLSQMILAGRDDDIQNALNSNFGIFGMVVTDPSGREVLFKTGNFFQKPSWQKLLSVDFLQKVAEPYDLLTDPPPLTPQYLHSTPRQDEAKSLTRPAGRVIGRLYYVRGVPPAFLEDLTTFANWAELRGSGRGYVLLTLVMIGFATSFTVSILWRQRILQLKEAELQTRENQLSLRRKALDHLNADIASQRKRKEWLEQESELAYQRALRIRESLLKLKEDIVIPDADGGESPDDEDGVIVRPPLHKASSLIGEVESLLPELTHNARVLRSQAEVWQSYCAQLEARQAELQRLLALRTSVAPGGRAAGLAEAYAPPENQPSVGKFS
jgi:hypothetical protein